MRALNGDVRARLGPQWGPVLANLDAHVDESTEETWAQTALTPGPQVGALLVMNAAPGATIRVFGPARRQVALPSRRSPEKRPYQEGEQMSPTVK